MNRVTLILVSVLLNACAIPTNSITAQRFYEGGEAAMLRGDYTTAVDQYNRSMINARIGYLGKGVVGNIGFNLAKALGLNCQTDEADRMFTKSIGSMDEHYGFESGRSIEARLEYSQFLFDYERFHDFLHELKVVLPQIDERVKNEFPTEYIEMLGLYAYAFQKTGDQVSNKQIIDKIMAFDPETDVSKINSKISIDLDFYCEKP